MDKFSYYSDGEYEYRIERHEDDSAAQFTGRLGKRVWSLAQRPVVPPVVITLDERGEHDGSYRTHRGGWLHPPQNQWESCGRVYLDNARDEPAAALRLLGEDVLAGCTQAAMERAAAGRLDHCQRWEGDRG